ncbi:MAG: type IX secretion system membrane protein PorP/SprF [Crocinitomicaceae bacterium]|nr:type IX secretion system membrane protein PorP/SprF [Crocinitomicaceae bacterium]
MQKSIIILGVFSLLLVLRVRAQQEPMFSQYMFNTLSINPAYAGSADRVSITAIHRSQWVKFEGAPVTQTITAHSPLRKESISIGGTIVNDQHGPVKETAIFGDVSYRIFMDKSRLAFGLKAGLNLFSANLLDLNPLTQDDQVFQSNIKTKTLPNFGFGAMWYSQRWFVGVSTPKLLQNKLIAGDLPDFNGNRERIHGFLIAGYVWDVSPYVKFKPTILFKAVNGAPPGVDVTANFLFYEKLWMGAMYRWNDSVGLLFQYEFNNRFKLGYAYDYIISDLSRYTAGSHEVMLGLNLGKGYNGDVSPRYF